MSNLEAVVSHSGENPCGCDVCGKRFARTDRLKCHIVRLTGLGDIMQFPK